MNSITGKKLKLPVLIVSENTADNATTKKIIAGEGFKPFFVKSVTEALDLIESKFFPSILANHSIDGTNALDLCIVVKKKSGMNSVFFILMVANVAPLPKEINDNMIDDYLRTPLKKPDLRTRLKNAQRVVLSTAAKVKSDHKLKKVIDELDSIKTEINTIKNERQLSQNTNNIQNGKLEAIGRLTAGIAHEINTPVQYVGDNIHFLKDSFTEIEQLLASFKSMHKALKEGNETAQIISDVESSLQKSDIDYLEKEIPETIRQSIDGLDRISEIVLAMRNLSHSGKDENVSLIVDEAIRNTITLTRNEWKHVAEMKTGFSPALPDVSCHRGEFNQVILNMIINAAHAIADDLEKSGKEKGIIEITTASKNNFAEIRISDTGTGIPDEIRDKIFDSFFTTKKAGIGTGQGLAISNAIIQTYGGNINIESEYGKGTTFIITLPFSTGKAPDSNSPNNQAIEQTETITPESTETIIPESSETTTHESNEKKRILFVDDEPEILKGLQRMLRRMVNNWEMVFCGSGEEALSILDKEPFDVIVTDCRMKGMNGIELLTIVKKSFPHITRIMLSGETDKDTLMNAVHIVHQFVAKPCDAMVLKATIYRTGMMKELLTDDSIRKVLSGIESLPTIPSLYAEVIRELNSPKASFQKVGEIISGDIAITSKVLQIVNSAYFGLPSTMANPESALIMLGLDTIKSLILHFEIFSQFKIKKSFLHLLKSLQEHHISTAALAKKIGKHLKLDIIATDQAFTAGLLHDCGKLVLIANFPDQYEEVLELTKKENASLTMCEKNILGITHAEAGAYLMGIWGLPSPIVEAINYHHQPLKSIESGIGPVTAVNIANALHHELTETSAKPATSTIHTDYIEAVGLTGKMEEIRHLCREDSGK